MHSHCGHSHAHGHSSDNSPRQAFRWAMLINLLYVVIQGVIAVRAHSNSLFADAIHNFGDVLGLGFAFLSTVLHGKSASKRFSYGFKKTTILAAIVNALMLVFTCGVIGYDALLKLSHPAPLATVDVMIVAAIGVCLNTGSALLFLRGQKDLNVRGAFLHLAYDALISLGVVVGAIVMYYTHWYWLDPLLGLAIVLLILLGTLSLLKDSLRLVMDGVPMGLDVEVIKQQLLSLPFVLDIHDLHVWALSTQENTLTAHIRVKPETLDTAHYDACIREVTEMIEREFHITHVTLQLETAHCEKGC